MVAVIDFKSEVLSRNLVLISRIMKGYYPKVEQAS